MSNDEPDAGGVCHDDASHVDWTRLGVENYVRLRYPLASRGVSNAISTIPSLQSRAWVCSGYGTATIVEWDTQR